LDGLLAMITPRGGECMARKRIKSRPGLFGMTYYYDELGRTIGKSRPGLLGDTRVYFDQDGTYAGRSRPGVFAKEVFTDRNNEYITSYDAFLGDVHFKNGRLLGTTRSGFFDCAYTTLDVEEEDAEDLCFDEDSDYGEFEDVYENDTFEENNCVRERYKGSKKLVLIALLVLALVVGAIVRIR